jgi:hypothetical protein
VSAFVLDAGALIAVERDDRSMLARLQVAAEEDIALATHAMIVAQVWRAADGRKAKLARSLSAVRVAAIGELEGRKAGELCGAADTDDPIDAALALLARPGDWILTSDPDDLGHLVEVAGSRANIVAV